VEGEGVKIVKRSQSFLNGLFIGLINPLQIPFWIAYGSYLISEHYIDNDDFLLNVFIIGICSGTMVVLTLIALLSKKIISKINIQTRLINKSIGIVLFVLAIYQIVKLTLHFVQ
jgi:threonine/homoserine/homoserine lactone efflux protein